MLQVWPDVFILTSFVGQTLERRSVEAAWNIRYILISSTTLQVTIYVLCITGRINRVAGSFITGRG
jgi:hypothetical protein